MKVLCSRRTHHDGTCGLQSRFRGSLEALLSIFARGRKVYGYVEGQRGMPFSVQLTTFVVRDHAILHVALLQVTFYAF